MSGDDEVKERRAGAHQADRRLKKRNRDIKLVLESKLERTIQNGNNGIHLKIDCRDDQNEQLHDVLLNGKLPLMPLPRRPERSLAERYLLSLLREGC